MSEFLFSVKFSCVSAVFPAFSTIFLRIKIIIARKTNIEATAKAAVKLYSLYKISICSGKVFVLPRMWPLTTLTAPNSPSARAEQRIIP